MSTQSIVASLLNGTLSESIVLMADNQVPVDVPVVLPLGDPAPVGDANAEAVPAALGHEDNQEAVQGNNQQVQPLEVYKTVIFLSTCSKT